MPVDTLITHGRIWLGKDDGFAESLAISDGKVLASGTTAQMEALAGPATRRIDLAGRFAMPGVCEAHAHLSSYGVGLLRDVDVSPDRVSDMAGLLDRIRARAAQTPKGGWVLARGYDHTRLAENRHPHRSELDAAAPDHLVWLTRTCGHMAVASSAVLAQAGIGHNTPDPDGGSIARDAQGLTGLLAENARFPVMALLPELTVADYVAGIEAGGQDMLRYGITSHMDAGVGMTSGMTELLAYQEAEATGRLPLRSTLCLMGDKDVNIFDEARAAGLKPQSGSDMLRYGPVKFFTDGSAGGYTAAMSRPYEGTTSTGLFCLSDAECDALARRVHDAGFQMAIHAIGDAAIEQVLNAMERAQTANPREDARHRIEHCGWLSAAQMARMARMGVWPAPQPTFMYYFGENYLQALGPERSAFAYPMRAFVDAGLNPSASSDCPVTPMNPFAGIANMVTRKTRTGVVIGPDQRLTMAEALHCYTAAGAFATHDEERRGRLVPGQFADLAVLSQDLLTAEPESIAATTCVMTVLGGEVVWRAEGV